jgi:hypothetical protein
MNTSNAPSTSAHASASDGITIAGGHVGDRDHIGIRSALRHLAVANQRRPADGTQIDRRLAMRFHAQRFGHLRDARISCACRWPYFTVRA